MTVEKTENCQKDLKYNNWLIDWLNTDLAMEDDCGAAPVYCPGVYPQLLKKGTISELLSCIILNVQCAFAHKKNPLVQHTLFNEMV